MYAVTTLKPRGIPTGNHQAYLAALGCANHPDRVPSARRPVLLRLPGALLLGELRPGEQLLRELRGLQARVRELLQRVRHAAAAAEARVQLGVDLQREGRDVEGTPSPTGE